MSNEFWKIFEEIFMMTSFTYPKICDDVADILKLFLLKSSLKNTQTKWTHESVPIVWEFVNNIRLRQRVKDIHPQFSLRIEKVYLIGKNLMM